MNFYTVGARMLKQQKKMIKQYSEIMDDPHGKNEALQTQIKDSITNQIMSEHREICRLGIQAMMIFKEEAANLMGESAWFITIRPNESTEWIPFLNKTITLLTRKCFIDFTASYEQKGTSEDDIGKGFHIHIVSQMKQRSKGEIIRDIKSTMGDMVAENCIEVIPTKNKMDIINNYLIDYKSKDEHKIKTKDWDNMWRTRENLQNIYVNETPNIRLAAHQVRGAAIEKCREAQVVVVEF